MEQNEKSPLLWALVGCAGLCLVGLCVFFGFGVYLLTETVESGQIASAEWQPDPKPDPMGGGPTEPPLDGPAPSGSGLPLQVEAVVTRVLGRAPVNQGAQCSFAVERHPSERGFWCRSQIVCAGSLLYGGSNAGYYDCQLEVDPEPRVIGGEDKTTSEDSDAAMQIDSSAGTLVVRDDRSGAHGEYRIEARIVSIERALD